MAKMLRVFKDFRGGLSEMANDNMPDNGLVLAKNTVPGDYAGISRSNGSVIAYPQISDIHPVVLLFEFQPASQEAMVIAFTQVDENSMNMYKFTGGNWDSVLLGTKKVLDYFVYAGVLYWLNGEKIKRYDGVNTPGDLSEYSGEGYSPSGLWSLVEKAVAVEQRGQRWFYATKDNQVIFTNVSYPNALAGTSAIDIRVTDGADDKINALHEFNEGLLVFLTRSVYYLSGWDFSGGTDIKLTRLNVTCGTKWPKTVKTVENAVIYLGIDGLYQLSLPYYATQIVSKNISEKKISKRLNEDTPKECYGEVFGGIYYLGLRFDDVIKEFRYYINEKSFWGEFTQQPYCYYRGGDALYLGCANGFVLKYDDNSFQYVDPASGLPMPIVFTAQTKGFDVAGAMFMDAKLKRAFVAVKQYQEQSTTLKLQIKADYADAAWDWTVNEVSFDDSLVWQEGNYDKAYWGWLDAVTKEISVNKKAKRIQYLFYDDHTGQPATIYGVGVLYKKKKVKGNREGITDVTPMYDD